MAKIDEITTEREPLDIDAWIDSAERPEAEVTLTSKGKSLAALAHLRKQRRKVLAGRTVAPGRMVKSSEATEFDEDIAELEAEVKAHERTFLLRGIDGDTHLELLRQNRESGAGEQGMINLVVSACMVAPTMTVDQVARMRKAVGEGQFGRLWRTAQSLSFDAEPDLDF